MRHSSLLSISTTLTYLIPSFALHLPPHSPRSSPPIPRPVPLLTASYPKTCFHITEPPQPALSPTLCCGILGLCWQMLHTSRLTPRTNQWIWRDREGCALGFFLPDLAAAPDDGSGVRAWRELVEQCANYSRYNGGGANGLIMPSLESDGFAIDADRARFAFAPTLLRG